MGRGGVSGTADRLAGGAGGVGSVLGVLGGLGEWALPTHCPQLGWGVRLGGYWEQVGALRVSRGGCGGWRRVWGTVWEH